MTAFQGKYHKHTKVVIIQLSWNIILLKNKKSKQDKKTYPMATLRWQYGKNKSPPVPESLRFSLGTEGTAKEQDKRQTSMKTPCFLTPRSLQNAFQIKLQANRDLHWSRHHSPSYTWYSDWNVRNVTLLRSWRKLEGIVALSQVSLPPPSTLVLYSLLCSLENIDDFEVTLSYDNHNYFIKVIET